MRLPGISVRRLGIRRQRGGGGFIHRNTTEDFEKDRWNMVKQDESKVWQLLKRRLPPGYTAERLEARSPPGVSDVLWSYQHPGQRTEVGFLELKDQELEVRPEQGIFLRTKWRAGVPAAVLCRYQGSLMLFSGNVPLSNSLRGLPQIHITPLSQGDHSQLWDAIRQSFKDQP